MCCSDDGNARNRVLAPSYFIHLCNVAITRGIRVLLLLCAFVFYFRPCFAFCGLVNSDLSHRIKICVGIIGPPLYAAGSKKDLARQKRSNRSRCRLKSRLLRAKGTVYWIGLYNPLSSYKEYDLTTLARWRCGLVLNTLTKNKSNFITGI